MANGGGLEDRDGKEPRVHNESTLGKVIPDEIRQISEAISATPFDQEIVFRRALVVFDRDDPIPPEHLPGFLAEMHVASLLEKFSRENPGKITISPVLNLDTTEQYLFERTPRGTFSVRRKNEAAKIAEYDQIIKVNGVIDSEGKATDVPVVIEVKAGYSAKGSTGSETLTHAAKPTELERKLKPLFELFKTDKFGYIFAVSPESMGSVEGRKYYEEKGILLAPLPLTILELGTQADIFRSRFYQPKPP